MKTLPLEMKYLNENTVSEILYLWMVIEFEEVVGVKVLLVEEEEYEKKKT